MVAVCSHLSSIADLYKCICYVCYDRRSNTTTMQNLWIAGLFSPAAKRTAESPSLFGTELDYRSEIWKLLNLFPSFTKLP